MVSKVINESELSTEQQVRTLWDLGGLTWRGLLRRTWTEMMKDDMLGRASELAFNFVMAVFPALLFLLALFSIFATHASGLREQLFGMLPYVLPLQAAELISKTIDEVLTAGAGGKLTFGVLLSLWAATSGTSSMMSALNAAYDVKERRPWWKSKVIALVLTLVVTALVLVALTLVLFGADISGWVGAHFGLQDRLVIAWRLIQWPIAFVLMTMAFAIVYYYGPDVKEQHWYWITPGSLLGVVLWLLTSFGFRLYLNYFNTYSRTYGSLGAVIILMMWFYVTGLGFLVGGEINSEIEHAAARRGHPEAKPEGEKKAA
jgi:membrane protein